MKSRKIVLCRPAGHHRERSHPCCAVFVLLPSLRTFSAHRLELACTGVLPETFATSIDPAKPVIDTVTGNKASTEYWLARAKAEPRTSAPLDDEGTLLNTLEVEVCVCE